MSEHHNSFTVPTWVVGVVKMLIPAIVAITAMYIKIELLRRDVVDNGSRISRMETLVEARAELIRANAYAISKLETKSNISDQVIKDSLVRIENDIRDVKNDLKDVQKKVIGITKS